MSAFWGESCPRIKLGLLATAQSWPQWVHRGRRSLKPTPQARPAQAADGGPSPRPVVLAHHLWQGSSASSANVPGLRASILNSSRLMNKHSFFNGEKKAPDFSFFLKKSPKAPRPPAGRRDTHSPRGAVATSSVRSPPRVSSPARVEQMLERFQLIEKQK